MTVTWLDRFVGIARAWASDENGASAAEYAVLTALVVVAVAAAIAALDLDVFYGVRQRVLDCVNGNC
jgi:Flp pilus assembly pilin Flp